MARCCLRQLSFVSRSEHPIVISSRHIQTFACQRKSHSRTDLYSSSYIIASTSAAAATSSTSILSPSSSSASTSTSFQNSAPCLEPIYQGQKQSTKKCSKSSSSHSSKPSPHDFLYYINHEQQQSTIFSGSDHGYDLSRKDLIEYMSILASRKLEPLNLQELYNILSFIKNYPSQTETATATKAKTKKSSSPLLADPIIVGLISYLFILARKPTESRRILNQAIKYVDNNINQTNSHKKNSLLAPAFAITLCYLPEQYSYNNNLVVLDIVNNALKVLPRRQIPPVVLNARLLTWIRLNNYSEISFRKIFKNMYPRCTKVFPPLRAIEILIKALFELGQRTQAEELFYSHLRNLAGHTPSLYTYSSMIAGYSSIGLPKDALNKLLSDLNIDYPSWTSSTDFLNTLLSAFLRAQYYSHAELLVNSYFHLSDLPLQPTSSMPPLPSTSLNRSNVPDPILEIISSNAPQTAVPTSIETYTILMSHYAQRDPRKGLHLFEHFRSLNMEANSSIAGALIRCYLHLNDSPKFENHDKALNIVLDMCSHRHVDGVPLAPSSDVHPSVFVHVFSGVLEYHSLPGAILIFNKMAQHSIVPHSNMLSMLLAHLNTLGRFQDMGVYTPSINHLNRFLSAPSSNTPSRFSALSPTKNTSLEQLKVLINQAKINNESLILKSSFQLINTFKIFCGVQPQLYNALIDHGVQSEKRRQNKISLLSAISTLLRISLNNPYNNQHLEEQQDSRNYHNNNNRTSSSINDNNNDNNNMDQLETQVANLHEDLKYSIIPYFERLNKVESNMYHKEYLKVGKNLRSRSLTNGQDTVSIILKGKALQRKHNKGMDLWDYVKREAGESTPDPYALSNILKHLYIESNIKNINVVLDEARQLGIPLSPQHYVHLIRSYCDQHLLYDAERIVLVKMPRDGVKPNMHIYLQLANCCAQMSHQERMNQYLQLASTVSSSPNYTHQFHEKETSVNNDDNYQDASDVQFENLDVEFLCHSAIIRLRYYYSVQEWSRGQQCIQRLVELLDIGQDSLIFFGKKEIEKTLHTLQRTISSSGNRIEKIIRHEIEPLSSQQKQDLNQALQMKADNFSRLANLMSNLSHKISVSLHESSKDLVKSIQLCYEVAS